MYPKIDFFIGLFLMAFSSAGYYIANKLPAAKKGLGPGDYPKVILGLLFILGLILAGYAFYQFKKTTPTGKKKFEKGEVRQVFLLAACVALYIKLLFYFGFLLLTPVIMFVMMYLFGLRKWIKMVVISIATSVITFVIFNNFLYVLLPRFNLF
jgi:hypothetical protein